MMSGYFLSAALSITRNAAYCDDGRDRGKGKLAAIHLRAGCGWGTGSVYIATVSKVACGKWQNKLR